jgi:hypothetical protein
MEHLVALIGHLAWPAALLAGLWLVRREVRLVVEGLAARIGSEAAEVTIGREGLQIR